MKRRRGYYDVLVRACAQHGGRAGVRHYRSGEYRTYTYSELYGVCEYVSQTLQLLQCRRGVVGILTERNPLIPCVIAAVHKNSPTFMFLDPSKDNSCIIKGINFEAILALHDIDKPYNALDKKPDREICVFDTVVKFYKLEGSSEVAAAVNNDYSYIVLTSGSTGEPKHVKVPIQCLQPNIDDLSKLFDMNSDDVVYLSTPLTFDPAMVELLLACESGASLLVAPPDADVLCPPPPCPHALTVWQTTPSLFFQFSNADISKILGAKSKLKVLALGGEPMNHFRQLKELKAEENVTRLYCLYGVTEMSCWASVAELRLDNVADDREVPLGSSLSETEMRVSSSNDTTLGNILLGSNSRKCSILNKPTPHSEFKGKRWIETGDVGEVKNGTIYFRGRTDEVIKRFGHKVNLQLIEKAAMRCTRVKSVSCLWLPAAHSILLYYTSDLLFCDELGLFLRSQLDEQHWPDRIIRIESMPLNRHGKVNKLDLAAKYTVEHDTDSLEFIKYFVMNELRSILKHKFSYEEIKDKHYLAIGGSSFLAVTLCNKLVESYPQLTQSVLTLLLSPKTTMEEFIHTLMRDVSYVRSTKTDLTLKRKKRKKTSRTTLVTFDVKKKPSVSMDNINVEQLWSYNTGKCVDATPTVFETDKAYVAVGSHSGKLVVLNASDGAVAGTLELNSRIEASVFCGQRGSGDTYGVVGTYSGAIVCFATSDCSIAWKVNVHSMIKSKATSAAGQLYVASYDGNVRCIDFETGIVKRVIRVGEHGISADLVAAGGAVLACTLGGLCAAVGVRDNTLLWRHRLASPVFGAPLLYHGGERAVCAEVAGVVHCLAVGSGVPLWKYDGAKGNIFSSFSIKCNGTADCDLLFGCHDSNLYCLHLKEDGVKLKWKALMSAPVYSTPCYLSEHLILAASNNGKITVIEAEDGKIAFTYSLPGETFSSPVALKEQIFIGCRDDRIYSLRCKVR